MELRVPEVPFGDDGGRAASLIVGGWQLSEGHRAERVDERGLFDDLAAMARRGWTTFDCADIYTGVEELFGRFRARHVGSLRQDGIELRFHTKYVPDLDALGSLTRESVERVIDRSLRRLGVERLDLVQFSWWDYEVPGYVDVTGWLDGMRRAGKVRTIGLTNFDVKRTEEMLASGVRLVSNQVQYSFLDRRPEHGMVDLARRHGMSLICYGALAGGLLSAKYVGADVPEEPLANRSLVKYRLIVDEAGGWARFRELLDVVDGVARRHGVSPSAIALRWVLDRDGVAAAMVGTFHGRHARSNMAAVSVRLSEGDRAELDAGVAELEDLEGDVFGLERVRGGRHARIMRTGLGKGG